MWRLAEREAMRRSLFVVAAMTILAGCDQSASSYTLYRGSPVPPLDRIHVATFDASGSEEYNKENCFIARDLFANQPGVTVRYWCEKGRYKP